MEFVKCTSCNTKKPENYYINIKTNIPYKSCEDCRDKSKAKHIQNMRNKHGAHQAPSLDSASYTPRKSMKLTPPVRPCESPRYSLCESEESKSEESESEEESEEESESPMHNHCESEEESPSQRLCESPAAACESELDLMKNILERYIYCNRFPTYLMDGSYYDSSSDKFVISIAEQTYYYNNKCKYGSELYEDIEKKLNISKFAGGSYKFNKRR